MRQKITINHIFGLAAGAIAAFFLFIEANVLMIYGVSAGITVNISLFNIITGSICLLLFFLVAKHFYKSNKNGLVRYFFFSILVSLFAVFLTVYLGGRLLDIEFIMDKLLAALQDEHGEFIMLIAAHLYVGILIFIFACSIFLFLRPKIRYITYISDEVKKMEEIGFGRTIEVKSNDELADLSRRINSMSVTLKEKQERELAEEESKNRLIADISHDLRTPLTSIMGYVDLIKENGFRDKDKCNQYMEVVDRRLHNMKSLIDQLFEFTKLNQKDLKLKKEETNLVPLLQYIDFEYGSLFKRMDYGWSMQVNADSIPVGLDVEKFMRAMGNLLENARKYSKPNTEIVLIAEQKENEVYISLSNETDEVTEQNVSYLFERFYKADESRNSNTSTGLGLPIVKKIIELHGGTIEVELKEKRICFQIILANKVD